MPGLPWEGSWAPEPPCPLTPQNPQPQETAHGAPGKENCTRSHPLWAHREVPWCTALPTHIPHVRHVSDLMVCMWWVGQWSREGQRYCGSRNPSQCVAVALTGLPGHGCRRSPVGISLRERPWLGAHHPAPDSPCSCGQGLQQSACLQSSLCFSGRWTHSFLGPIFTATSHRGLGVIQFTLCLVKKGRHHRSRAGAQVLRHGTGQGRLQEELGVGTSREKCSPRE